MSHWKTVRLGDFCEIVSGGTPSTSEEANWDGEICWATPKDLSDLEGTYIHDTPRKLTKVGLESCSASILPPNSVLFSSRAPIGHVAINTVPMATNQGFKSFIPDPAVVDAKFLYYWLKKNRPYLESIGNGATFKEVSKAVISKVEVSFPPIPEQRRIAAILDQAEALRTKRRATLAKLDALAQSIFIEMFGDPLEPVGSSTHVSFDSVARRITYGFTSPMKHLDQGIPILTAKNIRDGFIDFENVHFADRTEYNALSSKSKPERGDVLITKDGSIGRCAVVDSDFEICINQSVALVQLKLEKVIPTYIVGYLTTDRVQQVLKGMAKGNALAHLQITELAKMSIPLPRIATQHVFENRISALNRQKRANESSLLQLDVLFAALQHQAFRGDL
jgi:type I restriction enzyme S subunit